jgi:hypothetical protein
MLGKVNETGTLVSDWVHLCEIVVILGTDEVVRWFVWTICRIRVC